MLALLRNGYLILEDAAPRQLIATLDDDLTATFAETPFGTGSFYGETTKRFDVDLVGRVA